MARSWGAIAGLNESERRGAGSVADAGNRKNEKMPNSTYPPGYTDWRLDVSERVAVITGATGGIGRATALQLMHDGFKGVGVVDMRDEAAQIAEDVNRTAGRDVLVPFVGDVTDSEFRKSTFETLQAKFDAPVSVCVPAAGITADRLAVKINKETGAADIYPEADFERVMAINLQAPIYWALETIASVARDRKARGLKAWKPEERVQGVVVLIGSVSSEGNRGQISYATAKAGLEGAAATLAAEAMFHGIRSAIIHPGYTDTPMVRALGEDFINEHIIPKTQLRRLIKPEEIAHTISFMIRNSAVSGNIWADAGWHPSA